MVPDASCAVEFPLNTATGKRLPARLEDESVAVRVPHLIDIETARVLRRYVGHGRPTRQASNGLPINGGGG